MPEYVITDGGEDHLADVVRDRDGHYRVTIDGRTYDVDAITVEQSVSSFIVDGSCFEVHASRDRDRYTLLIGGEHHELTARNRRTRSTYGRGAGPAVGRQVIQAPMPGRVVRVVAQAGAVVETGAPLLILEAMKMENQLRSPIAGTVLEVAVSEGQVVATGEKLAVVE